MASTLKWERCELQYLVGVGVASIIKLRMGRVWLHAILKWGGGLRLPGNLLCSIASHLLSHPHTHTHAPPPPVGAGY